MVKSHSNNKWITKITIATIYSYWPLFNTSWFSCCDSVGEGEGWRMTRRRLAREACRGGTPSSKIKKSLLVNKYLLPFCTVCLNIC